MNKIITIVAAAVAAFPLYADLPYQFQQHVHRELKTLAALFAHPLKPQEEYLIVSRYVDSMAKIYDITIKYDADEVVNYIVNLLEKNYFRYANSTLLQDHELIHFSFQGIEIPLIRSYSDEEGSTVVTYTVVGIHRAKEHHYFKKHSHPCLSFEVQNDEIGVIFLNTGANACPTKSLEGSGNFLLEMLDAFMKEHHIKRISLYDAAQVASPDFNYQARLADLYVFRHGMTWYNKHGYFLENSGPHSDLVKGQLLKNMSMYQLLKAFDYLTGNFQEIRAGLKYNFPSFAYMIDQYYKNIRNNYVLLYTTIDQYRREVSHDVRIGEFFLWLWQKNPALYVKLIDMVLPETFSEYRFPDEYAWLRELRIGQGPFIKNLP